MQKPEKPECEARLRGKTLPWGAVKDGKPCGRGGGASIQRDGVWYCKTHDPARVAEREAKRDSEYNARLQAEMNEEKRAKRIQAAKEKVIEMAVAYFLNGPKEWGHAVGTARKQLRAAVHELEEARK